MKAITIGQPHAWAVIFGDKPYENRSWFLHYRGPLLIHAGKSREWLDDLAEYRDTPPIRDLAFGAIIGIVDAVDCLRPWDTPATKNGLLHPTATGPWCHAYSGPVPLDEPVPCKGQLGLWEVPQDVLEKVMARINESYWKEGRP